MFEFKDKHLGARILEEFSAVSKTLDDVHKKSSDAKSLSSDAVDNTEVAIKKIDKLKKVVEDGATKAQLDSVLKTLNRVDFDDVVESVKSLKRSVDRIEASKVRSVGGDERISRGKRRSESENDDGVTGARRRSRSTSNDVTLLSSSSDRKKRKKSSSKKRSRSSSTSSVEIEVADDKVLASMERNVGKLLGSVDQLESRLKIPLALLSHDRHINWCFDMRCAQPRSAF